MARNLTFIALCAVAAIGFCVAPYLIFFVAPTEPTMGFIQKIFYFHVPCAWSMLLGAMLSGGAGAVYLFTRGRRGEAWVIASADLTVVFGVLVLITGPLWAKVAWGHYWVWDVRLTTLLVLFLVFVGVLLARRFSGPMSRKVAAGLALFGAADVPLIYLSVKIWNTIHPKSSVVRTLGPKMRLAFWVSMLAITSLFVILLWLRIKLERSKSALDELHVELQQRELEASERVVPVQARGHS